MRRLTPFFVITALLVGVLAGPAPLAATGTAPHNPSLAARLTATDPATRIAAAAEAADLAAAGNLSPELIPVLAGGVKDAYYDVRINAGFALARLGTPAVPALLALLREDSYFGPLFGATAVAALPATAATPALATQLLDVAQKPGPDQQQQQHAAFALSRLDLAALGIKEPVQAAYLAATETSVGELLGEALLKVGPADPGFIEELIARLDRDTVAGRLLAGCGTNAVPVLARTVGLPEKRVAWLAIETLGTMGLAAAGAVAAFCKTLGKIGPGAKPAVPALIKTLAGTGSEETRIQAAQALAGIDGQDQTVLDALRIAAEKSESLRSVIYKIIPTLAPGQTPSQ